MAPRSNWKGYLKLSLVSASIAIYPATSSSEKVRFNTLNRATGNRLKRKMVDAVTEEEVPTEEQIKGYAVGKDTVRPGRGRRAFQHRHREHAHGRHREVRAESFDRRSLPRHAVLPRARGQGRAGSVRGHPRCHEKEEDGRYRSRRDGAARARDDARAVRQGHHGNDACTTRTRSAATRRCSRKSRR